MSHTITPVESSAVVVAAFGDAPQSRLAAGGALPRYEAEAGAELLSARELCEVTHAVRRAAGCFARCTVRSADRLLILEQEILR